MKILSALILFSALNAHADTRSSEPCVDQDFPIIEMVLRNAASWNVVEGSELFPELQSMYARGFGFTCSSIVDPELANIDARVRKKFEFAPLSPYTGDTLTLQIVLRGPGENEIKLTKGNY